MEFLLGEMAYAMVGKFVCKELRPPENIKIAMKVILHTLYTSLKSVIRKIAQ